MLVRLFHRCFWFQRKTDERNKVLFGFIIPGVPVQTQLSPSLLHEVRQNIRVVRMCDIWCNQEAEKGSQETGYILSTPHPQWPTFYIQAHLLILSPLNNAIIMTDQEVNPLVWSVWSECNHFSNIHHLISSLHEFVKNSHLETLTDSKHSVNIW